MKVAILLNRSQSRLRTMAKSLLNLPQRLADPEFVLPEYDSFARLLDDNPLVLGTGDPIDWNALGRCDALIWEWGWTREPPTTVLEIRRRCNLRILMFPGPLDRFWRELDPADFPLHMEAARATDAVGVMLEDMVGFYRALLPHAHVFHLPVPVAVDAFAAYAVPPAERDQNLILLTAPTRFTGSATQMPITTFLAFREVRRRHPRLRGLCFIYDEEERRQAEGILRELGLGEHVEIETYLRPIARYLKRVRACVAGIFLPHAAIQGRTAMLGAALGLPLVVSDEVETHRRLYAATAVRWYDVSSASRLADRLLADPEFRQAVGSTARGAVAEYGVSECRGRLADALRSASTRSSSAEGRS